MVRVRGADETVVRDAQVQAHLLEGGRVAVRELLGREAFLLCGLLHLEAVLVRSGHEENLMAVKALEARHGISRNDLIGVADVRHAIGVADCGGDVERGFLWRRHSSLYS